MEKPKISTMPLTKDYLGYMAKAEKKEAPSLGE